MISIILFFILCFALNLLIGCTTWILRFKRLTVADLIICLIVGWAIPLFFIVEKIFDLLFKLDEIDIIKRGKND